MNIGGRIKQRLKDLSWERKDLLEKVPDLSAQALSNLITRDSKRSEWDEAIAAALDVSVLWLVYGKEPQNIPAAEPQAATYLDPLSDDELKILRVFRGTDTKAKEALMMWVHTVLPDAEEGFRQRAEG